MTSTSKILVITTSTMLRQLIFHYEDSVQDPQTLVPLESWDSQLSLNILLDWGFGSTSLLTKTRQSWGFELRRYYFLPGGTIGYPAQPRLIAESVCQSVSSITFDYFVENGLGQADLANKHVTIVNRRGIVSRIFFKIKLYIMILTKIRVICTRY